MSGADTEGRAYAKLSQLKIGDWVEADAGFTCIRKGITRVVRGDVRGLFVKCDDGRHYLDGQLDFDDDGDDDILVGLYPAARP